MGVALLMLVAASAASDAAAPAGPLAAFTDEAAAWLLQGEDLPADYRLRLLRMEPDERLQAIVFLRRAGLLTGNPWSLTDLLRPAPAAPENRE